MIVSVLVKRCPVYHGFWRVYMGADKTSVRSQPAWILAIGHIRPNYPPVLKTAKRVEQKTVFERTGKNTYIERLSYIYISIIK
jgi:hypothetical protein